VSLPYVYKVTKYDPADWNEEGRYVGLEVETSDHGVKEAAYLAAVAAFADESGVAEVSIREPEVAGPVNFGLEAPIDGNGLTGQLAPDLRDYYDGAVVPLGVAIELVRAMLRDSGAWCRLEVEGRFLVHVGFDQYMYIGTHMPCEHALATAAGLGLFPVRLERSPYEATDEASGSPANAVFWANVADLVARHGTILLRESAVRNASRWHRLTAGTVDGIQLAPRAMLSVWPDLSNDVEAVQASAGSLYEYVWEDPAGGIHSVTLADPKAEDFPDGAVAAAALPLIEDEYNPLLEGVLPDPDGVLRARWSAS
jgi:small subunit ribosomal protein S1